MTISLRDYQIECLNTVFDEYQTGTNRQLIVLPTGSGKTIVMSAIAKYGNTKTLIVAHREELLYQTIEKLKLFWPDVSVGLCKGDQNEIHHQIVVGSVQTCSRPHRLAQLQVQGFNLMMIDEAHHATADSYQNVINGLGFEPGSGKLLVGVTATPQRTDKSGLGSIFDKISYSRSISTMIKAGYLSPVIGRKILTNLTLDDVRIQNGDFSVTDLAEAVNIPERNAFIADRFVKYAADRKAVAFCVDVQHCQNLSEAFNSIGIASAAVWGDMPSSDRQHVLESLKKGRIQVATSCGVLIEGFDEPSIDAIVMARPTRSSTLYTQCIGRGLRLWPGKKECLVLDFTDKGHNLDSIVSLNENIPEAIQIDESDRPIPERKVIDRTSRIQVIETIDQEFDVLGVARFTWVHINDNEWSLLDDEKREIVMRPYENGFVATLYLPSGYPKEIVSDPLPLEYCSGVCEDYARQYLKVAFANSNASWMNVCPSQKQISYLKRKNAWRDGMSKGEANTEIRRVVALEKKQKRLLTQQPLTSKQRYFLECRGIDAKAMSKLEARQAIAMLKRAA